LSGKISIENDDLWGNKTILNMVTPGNVFAENYACIPGEQLMVNIVVVEKSQILYLDMTQLLKQFRQDFYLTYPTRRRNKEVMNLTFHLTDSSLRII